VSRPSPYTTAICQWPEDDRPREKLAKYGPQRLSNSELLAILLRTGSKGESALGLARRILHKFKTFRHMSHTDVNDWKDFKGLGPAKIAQIAAAIEIGRRFREDEARETRPALKSSKDAADLLMPRMRDLKTEVFTVVYLDAGNCVIEIADAAIGTVNHAAPIVREVIHAALQKFAVSIICAHNHPSGQITPSQDDRRFTRHLRDAAHMMGVKALDHIIIGDNQHYSFADAGEM